jgi:hypothetical protein
VWSKWSKGAWTWLKARASSGRTNNARKGVDESVWAVQLVEHWAKKSQRGDDRARRKSRARGAKPPQAGRLRPAGLPYKWRPPVPIFCSQAALLPQFVCSSFCAQNDRRHSHPSWAWLLKQFTPLIHSKSTFRSNLWSA